MRPLWRQVKAQRWRILKRKNDEVFNKIDKIINIYKF